MMIRLRAQAGLFFVESDSEFTFSGGPNYCCASGALLPDALGLTPFGQSLRAASIGEFLELIYIFLD